MKAGLMPRRVRKGGEAEGWALAVLVRPTRARARGEQWGSGRGSFRVPTSDTRRLLTPQTSSGRPGPTGSKRPVCDAATLWGAPAGGGKAGLYRT